MIVQPTSDVVFNSKLKKLYKKGKLPIKYGIYGEKLTLKNVTDEHLLPRSFGGTKDIENIALATKQANWRRGREPIENFLTYEMLQNYCAQFKGIKLKDFDGNKYIEGIKRTIRMLIDETN